VALPLIDGQVPIPAGEFAGLSVVVVCLIAQQNMGAKECAGSGKPVSD